MNIRFILNRFLGVMLLLLFVMPAAFSAPTGKITIAMPSEPATLDPAKSNTRYNHTFNANIFESLYIRNAQADLVPGLAESVTISPDGLTYTFKLRKDVKFHDGTPFTADDVKFSFERALNPATKNPLVAFLKSIDKVEIDNPDTVSIKLKERDAILPKKLAFAGWIVPRKYLEAVGDEGFAKKPVGTGPFKFKSRSINEYIELEANEQHWGTVPKVKTLVYRAIPEDAVRLAMLQTGEVDIASEMPPALAGRISAIKGVKTMSQPSGAVYWVVINVKEASKDKGPLSNLKVRQALNYAVDKQGIIKGVLNGQATEVAGALVPSITPSDKMLKPYPYNPAMARKLLAEAGYPNGIKVEMFSSVGRYTLDKDISLAIANNLKAAGFDVDLNLWESTKWVQGLMKKTYPLSYQEFGNTVFDPEGLMIFGVHSKAFWSFYSNPQVDKLIEESTAIADQKQRDAHFQKIDRLLHEDASHLFLWESKIVLGVKDKLNWKPDAGDMWFKFWNASWER
jgi:peptide/nickel transport system substrate-binding protein